MGPNVQAQILKAEPLPLQGALSFLALGVLKINLDSSLPLPVLWSKFFLPEHKRARSLWLWG